MLPSFLIDNQPNRCLSNTEFFRSGAIAKAVKSFLIIFSYFKYYCIGKLGGLGFFSFLMKTPAFFVHISHIVSLRSDKKMGWINAQRNVASMKNMLFFFYLSIMDFPRKTMGTHKNSSWSSLNIYMTIPGASGSTLPGPAGFSFFNKFPESYFNGDWFGTGLHPIHLPNIRECVNA